MAETTASDHHVDIAPNPAASSHDAVEPSHENEQGRTGPDARELGCCSRVCSFILVLITLPITAVALLIYCLCALLAYLTFGKDVLSLKTVAEKLWGRLCFKAGSGNTGQFVFPELEKRYEDLNWSTAATAAFRWRLLLLSLLCLVIVVSVPTLKRTKVLGLPLWKWTVLAAVVTVGYHAFSLLIQCTVKKLSRKKEDKYDVVYYADGLRRSVNNVSFWVFILLAWEHYFRSSRHGLRRYGFSEKALDIGTWTVVSLLFGKILLLAKNVVMLSWESHAIYRQFTDNIGNVGPQLYFLGLVSGSKFDIFSPWGEEEDKGVGEGMNKPSAEENNGKEEDVNEKENKVKAAGECSGKEDDKKENEEEETTIKEKEKQINEKEEKNINEKKQRKKKNMDKEVQEKKAEEANRIISMNSKLSKASTYHKKQMAKYFILAAGLSSRKDNTVPEEIRKQWERLKKDDSDSITKDSVKKNLHDLKITINDAEINHLFHELSVVDNLKNNKDSASTDKIPYDTFKEWMEIHKQWERLKQKDDSDSSYITKDSLKKNLQDLNITAINDEVINRLFDELRAANNLKNNKDSASIDKDEIPYDTFEEWMTRAFKNCLSLGYMLSDAQGAANNLNNIMRAFVVIVVILCWLLLTGIASTKVLVTIASSFLGATFIFGDTLKATFEGIIFSFVTQPFIVGDLCIIDDIQLEVKQMDVLKTTFHKIDSKEEVLYPNKVLAEKTISNLKRHLDCRDCVELSLSQSVDIGQLEEKIKEFFEKNKGKFNEGSIITKEIGETIKIAIHFEHVMNIQDDTHAQRFKRKKEQKSELLKEIRKQIQTEKSSSAKNVVDCQDKELMKWHSI